MEREAARLMGLPETYLLPKTAKDANNLTGDGVVVPVVTFLAAHVIEPLLRYATAAIPAFEPYGAATESERTRPEIAGAIQLTVHCALKNRGHSHP
jgi:hypothetical protein